MGALLYGLFIRFLKLFQFFRDFFSKNLVFGSCVNLKSPIPFCRVPQRLPLWGVVPPQVVRRISFIALSLLPVSFPRSSLAVHSLFVLCSLVLPALDPRQFPDSSRARCSPRLLAASLGFVTASNSESSRRLRSSRSVVWLQYP